MSEYTQPNPAEIHQTRGERLADAIAATEGIATFNMQYGITPNGRQIARGGAQLGDLHAIESSIYGGPNHEGQVDQSLVAVIQTGNSETLGVIRALAEIEDNPTEGYFLVRMPTEPSQLSSTNRVQNPNATPQVIARLSPEVPVVITADGVGGKGSPNTNIVISDGELFVADLDPRPGLNARVMTRPSERRSADVSFRNASAVWRPDQATVLSLLTQVGPNDSPESINVTIQRHDITQTTDDLTPEAVSLAEPSDTLEGWSVDIESMQTPADVEHVLDGAAYEAIPDITDAARLIKAPFLARLAERVRTEGLVVTDEHLDAIDEEVRKILEIRNASIGSILMGATVDKASDKLDTEGIEQGNQESIKQELIDTSSMAETDRDQLEEQKRQRNNAVIARAIARVPQGRLTSVVQNVLGAIKKAELDNHDKISSESYPQLLEAVSQIIRSERGEALDIEAKTAERIFRRVQELSGGRPIPNEVWGATSNSSQLGRMRLHADTILRDTVLEIVKKQLAEH